MPLPEKARDLIEHVDGALEFRSAFWWDTYNEGRLFYPLGFADALGTLGLESTKTLSTGKYLEKAVPFIAGKTNWTKQLVDAKNWSECAGGQLRSAADEQPMLLSKAVQCMVALHLFAQDNIAAHGFFDAFKKIRLLPGVYSLRGLSFKTLNELVAAQHPCLEEFEAEARTLGQARARDILWDVSRSQEHVPWRVATLIQRHFNGVQGMTIAIDLAIRPPNRGLYPASSSVQPCQALVRDPTQR